MTKQIEVWILIDENGDYATGVDAEEAACEYESDIGCGDDTAKRLIKVTLNVPLPVVVELTGDVPSEGEAELVVAR